MKPVYINLILTILQAIIQAFSKAGNSLKSFIGFK